MDDKRSKVFIAHQGKFGSQWLHVVPGENLGLKNDDQQLRILIGFRLGGMEPVCRKPVCGIRFQEK